MVNVADCRVELVLKVQGGSVNIKKYDNLVADYYRCLEVMGEFNEISDFYEMVENCL